MNCRLGVLAKEELHDKVVAVRRVNDRVMSLDIVSEEEVVRVVCAYALQSGRCTPKKIFFRSIKRMDHSSHE